MLCDEPECLIDCIFKASTYWIPFTTYGITRKDAAIYIVAGLTIVVVFNTGVSTMVKSITDKGIIPVLVILSVVSTVASLALANFLGVERNLGKKY